LHANKTAPLAAAIAAAMVAAATNWLQYRSRCLHCLPLQCCCHYCHRHLTFAALLPLLPLLLLPLPLTVAVLLLSLPLLLLLPLLPRPLTVAVLLLSLPLLLLLPLVPPLLALAAARSATPTAYRCSAAAASLSSFSSPIMVCAVLFLMTDVNDLMAATATAMSGDLRSR
jgi:hypothetical protein